MKKKLLFLILPILLILFFMSFKRNQGLILNYKCLKTDPVSNSIFPAFNIINNSSQNVLLKDLAIRYYYTMEEPVASQQFNCYYAKIGSEFVEGKFVNTAGNLYYLELTFTGEQLIDTGGETGEIQACLNKENWSNFNQANDYSFNPDLTSFSEWHQVTLHYKGALVWGKGPNDDPQPPVVQIISPSNNAQFIEGVIIPFSVQASDPDGQVVEVAFLVNEQVIQKLSASPYQIDLKQLALGTQKLQAKATDNMGLATLSDPVNIEILIDNNIAPLVSLTAPATGSEYNIGDKIVVSAQAEDQDGTIARVEFFAGGMKIGQKTSLPYTIEWTALKADTYSITARAIDNQGKATISKPRTIKIVGDGKELPYSALIRLNQAGYVSDDASKTAVISNMNGVFTVHDFANDEIVYNGVLTSLGNDQATGENLYLADFSSLKKSGFYYLKIGKEKSPRFQIRDDLYNEVLYYTLRVYGANRCGPYDSWIHEPCHTLDGSIRNKPGSLTGGWHDCGDHVKFGGTLGYAADMLLYAYTAWPDKFGDVYSMNYDGTFNHPSPDGIPDVLNEVKVATDYILNLYNASLEDGLITANKMYYQVGDGDDDHSWWHKPEYQDDFPQAKGGPDREVWSDIGSDIAGRFSAALAMMAKAYQKFDADYAAACLKAARDIFKIGAHVYGQGGDSGGKGYYGPDGRMDDDMAFAAIMLYRATGEDFYLNDSTGAAYWMAKEKKWEFISYHVLSFPNIFSLALHAYYPHAPLVDTDPSTFGTKVVTKKECQQWLKKEAFTTQPIDDLYGRNWKYDWGTCRYMMGVAASAVMAYDLDPADKEMMTIAKNQMNWVLGRNQFGLSFVVGNKKDRWLTKYPQHPHHRAANPEGKNVPQLAPYSATELTGATIGGPESHTEFTDQWDCYQSTETGIDYWAGTFFVASYLSQTR